jgi:AcrR family transcriptional regulator
MLTAPILAEDVARVNINVDSSHNNIDSAHTKVDNGYADILERVSILMPQAELTDETARPYHHGDLRRGLIEAASSLLSEDQHWDFSLREVARRAGVSHNAPYNHFADKHDLLVAIAATGFRELRDRMQAAIEGVENPKTALLKTAVVYVTFGLENPARYRLMFGSALRASSAASSELFEAAGEGTRAVLDDIVYRGARAGVFAASPRKKEELQIAVLTAWSTVHGLTMLTLDGLAGNVAPNISKLPEKLARTIAHGLLRT